MFICSAVFYCRSLIHLLSDFIFVFLLSKIELLQRRNFVVYSFTLYVVCAGEDSQFWLRILHLKHLLFSLSFSEYY